MNQPITAYIDAGTMSMVIAGISGVVVAIGGGIAMYFTKFKKKVSKKLGIDENKNKEVEEDVVGKFGNESDKKD